ncbi:Protein PXR1 [Zalerion maritima]|uniref:PinX1-related protein 1 n=1 Tax=Zalerion maritima TaxID=339359 RepID=A0AAD5S0H7_9PEZI|nr:Protein PXR1 [Zalerion maritima]
MGLAGVQNRRKLAKDPNNTRWSRNEDTFGQKILRKHGWNPGQFLGVQDSSHSAHFTEANASHIRVNFRDGNAGIGMKKGSGDECTGLSAFQDLLGRLNGKSEETIQLEQKARTDYKANLYIERKYGGMRFVKGGLLVADKIEASDDDDQSSGNEPRTSIDPESQPEETSTSGKILKREKKKSKKRKAVDDTPDDDGDSQKKKKKKKTQSKKGSDEMAEAEVPINALIGETAKKRKRSKEEKAEKKSSRKDKKSKKSRSEGDESVSDLKKKDKKKRKDKNSRDLPASAEASYTQPSTETSRETSASASASGTRTPRHPSISAGRFHRSKFIASKRAAVMDQTALNQILMIKPTAAS